MLGEGEIVIWKINLSKCEKNASVWAKQPLHTACGRAKMKLLRPNPEALLRSKDKERIAWKGIKG